eukprot:6150662-Prymnesium_polylepis.1
MATVEVIGLWDGTESACSQILVPFLRPPRRTEHDARKKAKQSTFRLAKRSLDLLEFCRLVNPQAWSRWVQTKGISYGLREVKWAIPSHVAAFDPVCGLLLCCARSVAVVGGHFKAGGVFSERPGVRHRNRRFLPILQQELSLGVAMPIAGGHAELVAPCVPTAGS